MRLSFFFFFKIKKWVVIVIQIKSPSSLNTWGVREGNVRFRNLIYTGIDVAFCCVAYLVT